MANATESIAFDTAARERQADRLGMWVFIASEALLFAAVILAYLVVRAHHSAAFTAGSKELSFPLGTLNTAVLLTSSLAMALAEIRADAPNSFRQARLLMLAAAALGIVFLAIKFTEYHDEISRGLAPLFGWPFAFRGPDVRGAALFFDFYFAMTALHAVHLIVGILAIAGVAIFWGRAAAASRRRRTTAVALYWHFVDVIWVFLYPLLYLINR
ncbi:MAG TPA: cytochrome c oxidase subunit 3 [Bauldia sp.]|nr:cytochrome c oxidase subunit 3 [Bauldia sp.]